MPIDTLTFSPKILKKSRKSSSTLKLHYDKKISVLSLIAIVMSVGFIFSVDKLSLPPGGSQQLETFVQEAVGETSQSTTIPEISISNMKIASNKLYSVTKTMTGIPYYTDDKKSVIKNVPSVLIGSTLIKTASADKSAQSNAFLNFSIDKPSTIYVAFDSKAKNIPNWLKEFTPTTDYVTVSDSVKYLRLYKKEYQPGTITLGANKAKGSSASVNYTVFILPKPEDSAISRLQFACKSSGGIWTTFPNGCADTCASQTGENMMCTQVLTPGCDCGANKCWDGKSCVGNGSTPTSCTDTDGGRNYAVYGETTGYTPGIKEIYISKDMCLQNGINKADLQEAWCENNEVKVEIYSCPNGCSNGACLNSTNPPSI